MSSELVQHLNDSNFDSFIAESQVPVLVDFWAPWCGPCKMIAPTLDAIASEQNGKINVCKVNVDDSSEVASRFGIMGIPTLILFKGGNVVGQLTGNVPKGKIEDLIRQA